MDLTHDLSDCRPVDELNGGMPAGEASAAAPQDFNNVAALAYARWEKLRGEADLPAIAEESLSDARFLTSNCIQVAWDQHVSTPNVEYLGDDLAGQFAGIAGRAWPNVPIESPLVELLRRISRRAIDEWQAAEFDEQITDSHGWIRDCQGLALPFRGSEGAYLLVIVFDLDDPIIGEPVLQADPDDGVLLLEQELDPDDMPRPARETPPAPVLFVCVSDPERRLPVRPRQANGTARSLAKARWRRSSRDAVAGHAGPVPLMQPWEASFPEAEPRPLPAGPPAADSLLLSLQTARTEAEAASSSEERSHLALYRAIGAAYDFALLAADEPERLTAIMIEAGLKTQARAPMTPIVKLIFGAGHDRPRLAEYALALGHAARLRLPAGGFADYLLSFDGGLKGIVNAERQLRRLPTPSQQLPSTRLHAKLRKAAVGTLDTLEPAGPEFALVMTRRLADGTIALLGEVPPDERLLRAAARKLLARQPSSGKV